MRAPLLRVARGMLDKLAPPRGGLWGAAGRRFGRANGHYVFMCLAPSFLPSPAVRVTRIREISKRRRQALEECSSASVGCPRNANKLVNRFQRALQKRVCTAMFKKPDVCNPLKSHVDGPSENVQIALQLGQCT